MHVCCPAQSVWISVASQTNTNVLRACRLYERVRFPFTQAKSWKILGSDGDEPEIVDVDVVEERKKNGEGDEKKIEGGDEPSGVDATEMSGEKDGELVKRGGDGGHGERQNTPTINRPGDVSVRVNTRASSLHP